MADKSAIEWTDATWTPTRARFWDIQNDGSGKERIGWHCEHASEGCRNCYAEGFNRRLGTGRDFKPGELYREEKRGYNNGEVKLFLDEEMLTAPLRWKKQRMIFVCSMTDLFAEFVPDEWIDKVFAIMALAPQHTFQVLTKRAGRMRRYLSNPDMPRRIYELVCDLVTLDDVHAVLLAPGIDDPRLMPSWPRIHLGQWPLPNVWLGVSAERQQEADERIPELLATPAAVRFVSAEPLLGPIDFTNLCTGHYFIDAFLGQRFHDSPEGPNPPDQFTGMLDWIIVGGESGADARAMHPAWARSIRDQCARVGAPFFFKQWGAWKPTSSADGYWNGPKKNEREFPNSRGISMLGDGRICCRDFTVAEHARRIRDRIAFSARAIEVDESALAAFHRSMDDESRQSARLPVDVLRRQESRRSAARRHRAQRHAGDSAMKRYPTPGKPGHYWAKLVHPSSMPEGEDWQSSDWEVVAVDINDHQGKPGDQCYLGILVPGIGPTQWAEDFIWGPRIPDFFDERDQPGLTEAEQKAQGARCGCKGVDDMCVCQNVTDATTRADRAQRGRR